MIRTFRPEAGRIKVAEGDEARDSAGGATWIDLSEPTSQESAAVESLLGTAIPTHEDMVEIEKSSRLYSVGTIAIMTVPLLIKSTGAYPETTHIAFILTPRQLVTVRYGDPPSFSDFGEIIKRRPEALAGPGIAFAGLLDAIVDRLADTLEMTGRDLDVLGRAIFTAEATSRDLRGQMQKLGRSGEVISKASESLVGLALLVTFARGLDTVQADDNVARKVRTAGQDVEVLSQHAGWQTNKSAFLLDALLGMINIEQNSLIKIFSVVAVVFLPPTLIASIYGMNFKYMPELDWWLGYPVAIGVMIASMVVPYLIFRRKGWI
jgi:magnesium transporter